jgi:hypothetical protein
MGMSSLGNAFTRFARERKRIAFNESYFVVMIYQGTGGQQPAHTGADHDRMSAEVRHFHLGGLGLAPGWVIGLSSRWMVLDSA